MAVPAAAVLMTSAQALATPDPKTYGAAGGLHSEFPSHDPDVVREVVAVSHVRIDRVRELVEASPALAKAAWDWGFGDWESALGAASHMGRRDIVELLMDYGARPNLFTSTMLGHLAMVEAYVEAMPEIQRIPGPHGITLLSHAGNGGEPASPTGTPPTPADTTTTNVLGLSVIRPTGNAAQKVKKKGASAGMVC